MKNTRSDLLPLARRARRLERDANHITYAEQVAAYQAGRRRNRPRRPLTAHRRAEAIRHELVMACGGHAAMRVQKQALWNAANKAMADLCMVADREVRVTAHAGQARAA